jgi:hypothetical protein
MIAYRIAARLARGVMALTVVAAAVSSVSAATIVDSHGFETPFFTTTFNGNGQLEGQTPATFNGTWLRTKGIGTSTANVENTVFDAGSQAVVVHRAAGSDDRWGIPVDGYPSQRYVCIEWSMRVEQSSAPVGSFGPFFGVEAYDDDAATIGLLGSLGVDSANGEVLYQQQNTGFLVAPGPTVAFGAWNDFDIELDFLLHQYRIFFNDVHIATEGFVDQNNIIGGLNEFTDADIATFAAAGDPGSQSAVGTAFFDNFHVEESSLPCDFVIPEPAAGLLALTGLLGLTVRRRAIQRKR